METPDSSDELPFLEWRQPLEELQLTSKLRWNQSLKRFNTWRIGGKAACFIEVAQEEELCQLMSFIHKWEIPWFIIGKGSNLLLSDDLWEGIILRLSQSFKHWTPQKEKNHICVGAALADVTFAQRCIAQGWGGMEFMIGIPGTIGGAIAMNAGAHGGEIQDFLQQVWWVDTHGNKHSAEKRDLTFSYRSSPLNGRLGNIVTQAVFALNPSTPEAVRASVQKFLQFRRDRQPRTLPNCGSVFKNPENDYAARLIEASGLKGAQIGEAQVSTQHSNFIVNLGRAKSTDILNLICLIQKKVLEDHQVLLEREVQLLS